jgi:hypothetical protein
MNFVGVDACQKGWFAVTLDRQGIQDIAIFKNIQLKFLKSTGFCVIPNRQGAALENRIPNSVKSTPG